jgi:hypothetical protein
MTRRFQIAQLISAFLAVAAVPSAASALQSRHVVGLAFRGRQWIAAGLHRERLVHRHLLPPGVRGSQSPAGPLRPPGLPVAPGRCALCAKRREGAVGDCRRRSLAPR